LILRGCFLVPVRSQVRIRPMEEPYPMLRNRHHCMVGVVWAGMPRPILYCRRLALLISIFVSSRQMRWLRRCSRDSNCFGFNARRLAPHRAVPRRNRPLRSPPAAEERRHGGGDDGGGFGALERNPENLLFGIEYCKRCSFRNLTVRRASASA
jgi:hypothetical protein